MSDNKFINTHFRVENEVITRQLLQHLQSLSAFNQPNWIRTMIVTDGQEEELREYINRIAAYIISLIASYEEEDNYFYLENAKVATTHLIDNCSVNLNYLYDGKYIIPALLKMYASISDEYYLEQGYILADKLYENNFNNSINIDRQAILLNTLIDLYAIQQHSRLLPLINFLTGRIIQNTQLAQEGIYWRKAGLTSMLSVLHLQYTLCNTLVKLGKHFNNDAFYAIGKESLSFIRSLGYLHESDNDTLMILDMLQFEKEICQSFPAFDLPVLPELQQLNILVPDASLADQLTLMWPLLASSYTQSFTGDFTGYCNINISEQEYNRRIVWQTFNRTVSRIQFSLQKVGQSFGLRSGTLTSPEAFKEMMIHYAVYLDKSEVEDILGVYHLELFRWDLEEKLIRSFTGIISDGNRELPDNFLTAVIQLNPSGTFIDVAIDISIKVRSIVFNDTWVPEGKHTIFILPDRQTCKVKEFRLQKTDKEILTAFTGNQQSLPTVGEILDTLVNQYANEELLPDDILIRIKNYWKEGVLLTTNN